MYLTISDLQVLNKMKNFKHPTRISELCFPNIFMLLPIFYLAFVWKVRHGYLVGRIVGRIYTK